MSFDRSEERGPFLFLSLPVHIWGHSLCCGFFPLLWSVFGVCASGSQDKIQYLTSQRGAGAAEEALVHGEF